MDVGLPRRINAGFLFVPAARPGVPRQPWLLGAPGRAPRRVEVCTSRSLTDGDPSVRVVRGGSWFFPAEDLRASARGRNASRADDLGFRVVAKARFWRQASIPPAIQLGE